MTMTLSRPDLARRSRASIHGSGERTLVLGHGFCSSQAGFRHQVGAFGATHTVVTYDLAGFGRSDPAVFDPARHARLEGYAEDLVGLLDELDLERVTLVGASMSAMIALLASLERPERVEGLVFVGASPRYLNDERYHGGFDRAGIDEFYQAVESSPNWGEGFAGLILNNPASLALQEVLESVRVVRREVARVVARAIFESDFRSTLARAQHPVLIVQTSADSAVPVSVARYLAQRLPDAELALLPGVGHLPHLTDPVVFNAALSCFLDRVTA